MSQRRPNPDIQSQWDRFERWVTRFRRTTSSIVDDLTKKELVDTPDYLFLLRWSEYRGLMVPPHECGDLQMLEERAKEKISFLRGYLVDISFDGAEFMALKSSFLTLQYQSRCDSVMGFWFEQWPENSRPGAYHSFQEDEVALFAISPNDIDFESVNNILPFDRIFIKQAGGASWSELKAKEIRQVIKNDLGMSQQQFAKIIGVGSPMISITFNKRML